MKNEKYNHCSKYNESVKNVVLERDSFIDLQKIRNITYEAFTSTLNANQGLGEYDNMTGTNQAMETLVPPLGHTKRNRDIVAYKNFARVLQDHLLKKYTINKETCSKAYKFLIRNQLNKD